MRFPGAGWTIVAHHFADSGPPVYNEDAARLRAGERWSDCRWWMWWALENWLTEHPEIDAVVWCDDDLGRAIFDFIDAGDIDEGWALTRRMFARSTSNGAVLGLFSSLPSLPPGSPRATSN